MGLVVLMLAAGATLGGVQSAQTPDAEQSRKCAYTVELAGAHGNATRFDKGAANAPMLLRAVDMHVASCPVLIRADTGQFVEAPARRPGPAQRMPAR